MSSSSAAVKIQMEWQKLHGQILAVRESNPGWTTQQIADAVGVKRPTVQKHLLTQKEHELRTR